MRKSCDQRDQARPAAGAGCAVALAEHIRAAAILAWTESRATARLVARHRPRPPIVALATRKETARRLALVWGVVPLLASAADGPDAMLENAPALAVEKG